MFCICVACLDFFPRFKSQRFLLFHSFPTIRPGVVDNRVSTWGATRGQRQVKKGNKPYTDDLTQLRAKPEDFQSEEEEVDSASEVGIMGGWFWAQFP